ncbi:MAG: ornithine carbamoyltransferase [Gemmatimonadetes bacterium]|nr:ornithine carbamoyltransferase [Gemmatimonadota bacterium]
MPKRDFLALTDLSAKEIVSVLDLAAKMKAGRYRGTPLKGKTLAMIFAKSSTRTRVSFEVGAHQLGGQAIFLSSRDIQLGRGEPAQDTARVLSRYVHGIMVRTYAHDEAAVLAEHSTVPVINGLTDLLHPCQVLADLMTVREAFGTWKGKVVAWVGDGNNMANTWLQAAGLLGFTLRIAVPEGYEPNRQIFEWAQARAPVSIYEDPEEAVPGAQVVSTDVWASMGQEGEAEIRALAFRGYVVDSDLMKLAAPNAIFLHCLPAHRGEEVAPEVIDGPQSRVWDQAENRLHVQKAVMATLIGGSAGRRVGGSSARGKGKNRRQRSKRTP